MVVTLPPSVSLYNLRGWCQEIFSTSGEVLT